MLKIECFGSYAKFYVLNIAFVIAVFCHNFKKDLRYKAAEKEL